VFESCSCTHVLIQVKVYASKLNTKTLALWKSKTSKGLGFGSTRQEEKERKTPRYVCTSYENNESHEVFIY
jgi:hypothetical protein